MRNNVWPESDSTLSETHHARENANAPLKNLSPKRCVGREREGSCCFATRSFAVSHTHNRRLYYPPLGMGQEQSGEGTLLTFHCWFRSFLSMVFVFPCARDRWMDVKAKEGMGALFSRSTLNAILLAPVSRWAWAFARRQALRWARYVCD